MPRRLSLLGWLLLPILALAERPPAPLDIVVRDNRPRVILPEEPIPPVGGMQYRIWIDTSSDLGNWETAGEMTPDSNGTLAFTSGGDAMRFHRLRLELLHTGQPADGAETFGFNRMFREELQRVGWLTPAEFAAQLDLPEYVGQLSFDPQTALYWDAFSADPAEVNAGKTLGDPGWRTYDFRLNEDELAIFLQNGFVVSGRLGSDRFADVFYRIFNDDLPVFVSTDCAVHAWHWSYQHMLSEMEETVLYPSLKDILNGMATTLASLSPQVREGPLKDHLDDAEYFLAVGRNLLRLPSEPVIPSDHPRVAPTLEAINTPFPQLHYGFEMFGGSRDVDFTQYIVRGYYTRSLQLSSYFKATMWTARTDLRVFGNSLGEPQALRELGTAVALALLLQESEGDLIDRWHRMNDILRLFVGQTDSMNFAHLLPLLEAGGIDSLESVTSPQQIADLQQAIADGTLGLQLIPGDVYPTPFGPQTTQLPRSFAFNGQRFIPDGWAMAQVTFDRIQWPEDLPGLTFATKVLRRMCSGLDVAFSVLGNRSVGDLIAERMLAAHVPDDFRDGYPYAHNLMAVAGTFDRCSPEAWGATLYGRWLWALRALSAPTIGSEYPEAMRTRAWARKNLNTQLASYAELKHDTLLYGKQPYAGMIVCEYPAGFVEPEPEFWARMAALADAAADGQEQLGPAGPTVRVTGFDEWGNLAGSEWVDPEQRRQARIGFCHAFANCMRTLEALARKELLQQPFAEEDVLFIRGLMNAQDHEYGGATYDGWYPRLFYTDYLENAGRAPESNGSNRADALVADIFTAPPDWVDPVGGVLHEATGGIDLLMIAIDNGPDHMVYAGPVLSHYEFVAPGLKRWTDEEWQWGGSRDRPEWTQHYLVPR